MVDRTSLLDALASLALPTGGWGYTPGQPAHLEPTCYSLLALASQRERYAGAIDSGTRLITECQRGDGAFVLPRGRDEAVWPTAMVLLTRVVLGHNATELQATANFLTHLAGRVVPADPEMSEVTDIDLTRVGWPWACGNFAWVEPTAWACLALAKAGLENSPRVAEGRTLLLDRAFDSGGANYGNRVVLGRMTEPIPTPTALMLLALQGKTDQPRVRAALCYLRDQAIHTTDMEHLAWAKLAFQVHSAFDGVAEACAVVDARLRDALAAFDSAPIPRRALALIALGPAEENPFRVRFASNGVAPSAKDMPELKTTPPAPPLATRLKNRFHNVLVNGLGSLRQPPATSAVHIADAPDYDCDLATILRQQFEHFRAVVPMHGKRVVLKPNLVEWHRDKVINTDPRVVSAVIELCKQEGAAEIIVAEGPGHWRNVHYLVEESGLGPVLRRYGVPFVDLNHDEPVKSFNLGRLTGLEYLYLARTVTTADVFVSLPKLKTHHWAGATLSLKNLFGTVPGICYGWPKNELHWRGIPNSIIDIALTHTPHLAIVDGIVGMEGDGPLNGTAKPMGVLVMGHDLVAVDATCCRLMGIDPHRIPYLMLGARKKLGRLAENEISQLGLSIAQRAKSFELPPKIEKQLLPMTASV